jgi:hypothetical protein
VSRVPAYTEPAAAFPALVNKRQIVQVDNALWSALASVLLFPALSQLVDPWLDQLALQNPLIFRSRLSNSNLQHF